MSKAKDEEREPIEGIFVHCQVCGVGKFFEGKRDNGWGAVHALTHRRSRG